MGRLSRIVRNISESEMVQSRTELEDAWQAPTLGQNAFRTGVDTGKDMKAVLRSIFELATRKKVVSKQKIKRAKQ